MLHPCMSLHLEMKQLERLHVVSSALVEVIPLFDLFSGLSYSRRPPTPHSPTFSIKKLQILLKLPQPDGAAERFPEVFLDAK